ncbi:MAG: hypothetical protein CBC42_01490 [Betaproteobacteria bacterium TMED82]|nr:MAG: hypothetical protein CBC42_01490 [Betaproteobacteria bacterium TMED82]|tara:strand:+ start:32600 stop:33439 length:840 start_codon:yes stop_codon:yes gene_type:complete
MESVNMDKFKLSDGTFIRYTSVGEGPPLILLHTIRNRLEYSNAVAGELKRKYSVYSLDLPGFGDSPINTRTVYSQNFFTNTIVHFINELDLEEVTLAGESIGGVLPVMIAIQIPKKIKKIYCFNPYDYDQKFGDGIRRGNFFANFILFHVGLPLIGNLFSSLENKFILKNILLGGFYDKSNLSDDYINLLSTSTKKSGYVYHFRSVLSNFRTWTDCKQKYSSLRVPVKLIYGEYDWASPNDRLLTQTMLGLKSYITLEKCGHFSFLEKQDEVAKLILEE